MPELTQVMDLRTNEYVAEYDLEPMSAVIAAFAQFEESNFNTWDYEELYYPLLTVGSYTVSCGDYTALIDPAKSSLIGGLSL